MIQDDRNASPNPHAAYNDHEINIDGSCNNTVAVGGGGVDKLKNIRPFTESQLLSLHPVDEIDDLASTFNEYFLQVSTFFVYLILGLSNVTLDCILFTMNLFSPALLEN